MHPVRHIALLVSHRMYTVICLIFVIKNICVKKSCYIFRTSVSVYTTSFNNDICERRVDWSSHVMCMCTHVHVHVTE